VADSFDDKSALDMVYNERNRCVAAMCSMAQRLNWSAWLGKHEPAHDHACYRRAYVTVDGERTTFNALRRR
jgi:hypothetical protein